MSNKPASLFKRFTAFFIDLILIAVVYFLFTTFIATPVSERNYGYSEKIEYLDQTVAQEIVDFGLGYIENDTVNIYELESYVEKKIEDYKVANPGVEFNEETLSEQYSAEYLTQYEACLESLNNNEEYSETLLLVSSINLTNFLLSMFFAEIIFLFTIPLLTKNKQTIGQFLLHLVTITKGDLKIKNKSIIIRFVVMYLLETAFVYIVFKNSAFFAALFLLMVLPLMTPRKQNLHDMISLTKIADLDSAQIFETVEEKNKYDEKRKKEGE